MAQALLGAVWGELAPPTSIEDCEL
jgi:hypothetical protein